MLAVMYQTMQPIAKSKKNRNDEDIQKTFGLHRCLMV